VADSSFALQARLHLTRNVRVADHAPGFPAASLARTRQNRSPVVVKDAVRSEAVTTRSTTVDVKVFEELTCIR
jgi:hypothetical protein